MLMYKRSFAFLLSLAFIFIFFLSCSEETPLSPDDSAEVYLEEFPFFPLSEDFVAVYKYVSKDNPDSPRKSPMEEWQALLRLEVIRTIEKEESAFYKIEKTVLFPVEGYEGDLAEIDPADIDHSRTIVQEYDILYQDSTLWYVDHAPSFEKLEQGIKTFFYTSPYIWRSFINLTIFGIPDKYPLSDIVLYEVDGRCGYEPEKIKILIESGVSIIKRYHCDRIGICDKCEVFMWADEKTGILFILELRSQGMTSYLWGHRFEVELIE